ncbi:hypothetical protein SKAU_G00057030 [Synaphobranchus kaupii]|uniref:Hexosyltransferase n=1 Tax=Synaphobranchus kaupii TaxID=118154 RepID=A0A9Q1J9Z9_SYNKA|nr:hypothetical protein SKAU_G00057030 [Synaphobranchus kaupii]
MRRSWKRAKADCGTRIKTAAIYPELTHDGGGPYQVAGWPPQCRLARTFYMSSSEGRSGHSTACGYDYLLSHNLLACLQPYHNACRNDILRIRPDEWLRRCIIDYLGLSCVRVHQISLYSDHRRGRVMELSVSRAER